MFEAGTTLIETLPVRAPRNASYEIFLVFLVGTKNPT